MFSVLPWGNYVVKYTAVAELPGFTLLRPQGLLISLQFPCNSLATCFLLHMPVKGEGICFFGAALYTLRKDATGIRAIIFARKKKGFKLGNLYICEKPRTISFGITMLKPPRQGPSQEPSSTANPGPKTADKYFIA